MPTLFVLLALLLPAAHAAPSACRDSAELVERTMTGDLGQEEVACLEGRLRSARSRGEGERVWRLLLADAMARDAHGRWRGLVRDRHAWRAAWEKPADAGLAGVDCSDPAGYIENPRACHVRKKARALRERLGGVEVPVIPEGTGAPCPDVDELFQRATTGELDQGELRCLGDRLEEDLPPDLSVMFLQVLLEDARQRGGTGAVYALLQSLFGGIDCTDAEVWYANEPACDAMSGLLDLVEDGP